MLKDLLQKHDKDIFTDELVEKVSAMVEDDIKTQVDERLVVLKEKYDAKLEEMETLVEEKSKAYEEERNELEMAKVEAIEKYLEDLKEEVFEANKIDYENAAIVTEAIQVHKINKALQEKYNIDSTPEKIEENAELNKLKDDYDKLYKLSKKEYTDKVKAQNDLIIYQLAEDLETDTDKDKLLAISESIKFEDSEDFKVKLTESKRLMFNLNEDKKDEEPKKKVLNENTKEKDTKKKTLAERYPWLAK